MERWIQPWLRGLLLSAMVLLTGCFQYDLDIQFDSQIQGQWVQQLRWSEGAIATDPLPNAWVDRLSARTLAAGGTLRTLENHGLEMTIPFHSGQDLVQRFNQFFEPAEAGEPFALLGGKPIYAQLALQQQNWLVAVNTHISLWVDLTAVPRLSDFSPLFTNTQLLAGGIQITTPWGLYDRSPEEIDGKWFLTSGEVNQIEADFWLPSPVGIGGLVIALLVAIGYRLKYGRLDKLKS